MVSSLLVSTFAVLLAAPVVTAPPAAPPPPSATPRPLTISPNHPLDVRGTRAFLVGNGYAPVVRVTDGNGKVAFEGPVITRPQDSALKSTIVIKVPDAAPRQIGLVGVFLPSYELLDGVPISTFPQPLT